MKRIRNLLVFTVLLISLNHAESIRAQDLEVVFKNSLWGAGIGALVAVTSWALAEEQESDELRKNLIQYSAVGVIGGMGYGFFRISQGGGVSGMEATSDAIAHYDFKQNRLTLQSLPPEPAIFPNGRLSWKWNLFGARF